MGGKHWLYVGITAIAIAGGVVARRAWGGDDTAARMGAMGSVERPELFDVADHMQLERYQSLIAFMKDATADEIRALVHLDALLDLDKLPVNREVLGLIGPRWVRLDPVGALVYARYLEARFDSNAFNLFNGLYAAWVVADPEKATRALAEEGEKVIRELYDACAWEGLDDSALVIAKAFPYVLEEKMPSRAPARTSNEEVAAAKVVAKAARIEDALATIRLYVDDPDYASALAHQVEPGHRLRKAQNLEEFFRRISAKDPATGDRLLAELKPGKMRSVVLATVAENRGEGSVDAALEWFGKLSLERGERSAAFAGLADGFDIQGRPDAVEELMAELRWSVPPEGRFALDSTVRSLANDDPSRAARFMGKSGRGEELGSVIHQWASRDMVGAFRWAQGIPHLTAFADVSLSISLGEPEELTNVLGSLPEKDNGFRSRMLEETLVEWAWASVPAAMDWLKDYPGADADRLRAKVIEIWGEIDVAAATKQIGTIKGQQLRRNVVGAIADALAKERGRGDAAEWLRAEVPRGDGVAAVASSVTAWAKTAPEPAVKWVSQLESGEFRDAAVFGLVRSQVPDNDHLGWKGELESALGWASSIAGPELRVEALQTVFREWRRRDPDEANERVGELKLDPAELENVVREEVP